jgi:predicted Zn-dependent protease
MKTMHSRLGSLLLRVTLAAATALPSMSALAAKPDKAAAKEAAAAAKELVRKDDLGRHLRMAQLLLDGGDNADATREAQEALKLDKKSVEARRILAAAFARDKAYDKALETLATLDADVPGDLWVATLRAEILATQGDKPKALLAFEELCKLQNAPILAHYLAAKILDEQRLAGDLQAAAREKAHLAAFLAAPGSVNTAEARDAQRMQLESVHGDVGKMFFQAREAYFAGFRTGGAISAGWITQSEKGMEKVIATPGADKELVQQAHAFLGMCFASVKSHRYDLMAAERELRQAPNLSAAWFELGRIYRETDRMSEAAQAFYKAMQLDPRNAEAQYQLGVVYKALNRTADALRAFETVVRFNPNAPAATKALSELQALAPDSPVVAQYSNRLSSPPDADLFSTERYKAGIQAVEKEMLGGVEEGAEVVWLEKMMRRIVATNELPERVPFRVKVGKTMMINAFATPNGTMYVTRGFLAHLKKRWPGTPLDENNSYMAGVMAHELAHVVKGHILNRDLFRKALEQKGGEMDATLFRLTTRLNEIEADREGFLWTLAAGYNPNAMVEWMEVAAADLGDPPPMEDHPTFDERVQFLLDFWTNDVRFAYQAFETGTQALKEAQATEHKDLAGARAKYDIAATELDRYVRFFRGSKEAWNNLAVAQAKLGVIDLGEASPLGKWYTPMSIERTVALALPKISRKKRGKDEVFLARAAESLRKSLELDGKYGKALVNLAAVQIGLKENDKAEATLKLAKAAGAEPVMLATLTGILAAEKGQWDAAIAAFEAAGKASAGDSRALYCLALARQLKGDKAGAKVAYQQFLDKEDAKSPWAAVAKQVVSSMQ